MLKGAIPTMTNQHLGPYEPLEDHGGPWLNADSNVSTAQEYDVSFAALGHLALGLDKPDDANFLFGRALEYRTFFNPETGFFQARDERGQMAQPRQLGDLLRGQQVDLPLVRPARHPGSRRSPRRF